MSAAADTARHAAPWAGAGPFDLDDDQAYRAWRAAKLEGAPRHADDVRVELADAARPTAAERAALRRCIARCNVALYRSGTRARPAAIPRALGAALGLVRLDANWLADEDGISRIEVSDRTDTAADASAGRGGYIPYTTHALGWHTDGYYHPDARRIHAMVLHTVRPAAAGGGNALYDPELAYIALRDADPAHIAALMQADAMTIPAREDERGVARAAQSGPVIALVPGGLHLRYTARTRSIAWKDDGATPRAAAALAALLGGAAPADAGSTNEHPAGTLGLLRVRFDAGEGLIGHNVLHTRDAFRDDPAAPRLVLRARFLDRVPPQA